MKVIYWLKSISYCIVRLVMKGALNEGLKFPRAMQKLHLLLSIPINAVYRIVEMRILTQKKKTLHCIVREDSLA